MNFSIIFVLKFKDDFGYDERSKDCRTKGIFFYEIIFCLLKKEILDYKNKIGVTD
jgi:hypothetical protein